MISTAAAQQPQNTHLAARKSLIAKNPHIHGIDYLRVLDAQHLALVLLKPAPSVADKLLPHIEPQQLSVQLQDLSLITPVVQQISHDELDYALRVKLDRRIDGASLSQIKVSINSQVFDPYFSTAQTTDLGSDEGEIDVSEVTSGFKPIPRINYLAKDYDSFKQLIESELSFHIPQWQERNAADLMTAINEVLAYSGDMLSYQQDVVATEAYLHTSRFELSARRHCRLLDYRFDRQPSPRCWTTIQVSGPLLVPGGTPFFCGGSGQQQPVLAEAEYRNRAGGQEAVFESLFVQECHPALNALSVFDFHIPGFTLNQGATEATLNGHVTLKQGQLLAWVNQHHRHRNQVVRLNYDAALDHDPLSGNAITRVSWYAEDKLLDNWAAADTQVCGNVLLLERGETLPLEPLAVTQRYGYCAAHLSRGDMVQIQHYEQQLAQQKPASDLNTAITSGIAPALQILEAIDPIEPKNADLMTEKGGDVGQWLWQCQPDFLNSKPLSRDVILEKHQGSATVRFGNGHFGAYPNLQNHFYARYRVSPPMTKQQGPERINQLYLQQGNDKAIELVLSVGNITAAKLSQQPLSLKEHKLIAPMMHKSRLNLALPQDYLQKLMGRSELLDAHYEQGWSGTRELMNFYLYPRSWQFSGDDLAMMNADIAKNQVLNQTPVLQLFQPLLLHIALQITLTQNASAHQTQQRIEQQLTDVMPNSLLARHRFGFAKPLYASQVLEALSGIANIEDVQITSLQPLADFLGCGQQPKVQQRIQPSGHEVICYRSIRQSSIINLQLR